MLERMLQAGINGALTSVLFVIFIILPIILIQIILKKTYNKIKNIKSSAVNNNIESKEKEDISDKTYKILKIILISILIIVLCILGYILYAYNQKTLNSLNGQIDNLHHTVSRKNQEISKLKKEQSSNYKQLAFMNKYIAIVPNHTTVYHKYGCQYLDLSDFLVFNISNAEAQGYTACPHCIK